MLRKSSILIVSLFFIFNHAPLFAGIRCGNDIISTGNTKSVVAAKIQSCGQILDKDAYLKTVEDAEDNTIKTEKKIDLWSVRIKERGNNYCYPLTFEDGVLTDIGAWSRCN
ncbi:MAG: DUF2845 domain-containing protein [Desulfobacter sp.]|nr:MAG: DUF2845 domain-containing protein [Desulfobacter sp.]